jgi:hypothetical protein
MNNPWLGHVGEVINNRYPLIELLHSDDDSAIYRTESPKEPGGKILQILKVDPDDGDTYLSRWRMVRGLNHPHILRIFDAGPVEAAEDGSVIFLVSEEPDDVLASVLTERPLNERETREVGEALSGALAALHGRGLIHGAIRPDSVFAVGEKIKISGDGISPAEDASAATDVCDLGLLLIACLQQGVPDKAEIEHVISSLPAPFRDIAERTLETDPQKRWTAARVHSVIRGETPAELPPNAPRTIPLPRFRKPLVYAAATAVAVLLIAVTIDRTRSTPEAGPAPVAAPVVAAPEVKPSAATPVPRQPVREPVRRVAPSPRPEGARARVTPPARAEERSSPGTHLVVVATYNRAQDAEKRARAITNRWPKFPATVLAPNQPNPPYFVTIGANLSKESAQRLQQRARAAGLPRDTYVTR